MHTDGILSRMRRPLPCPGPNLILPHPFMSSTKSTATILHRLIVVAATAVLPLLAVSVFVIWSSINPDIEFVTQERRGNDLQKPLAVLLDALPRHQAATQLGTAGAAAATDLARRIDTALAELETLAEQSADALQLTPDGLASRQRASAAPAAIRTAWDKLKNTPAAQLADGTATTDLMARCRMLVAHAGDTSNLILDPDLDSYYLMDITLIALPQTQDRLARIMHEVTTLLADGVSLEDRSAIAAQAALLREGDMDRIAADVQTALNEDKNFYDLLPSLQSKLPVAAAAYASASATFADLLGGIAKTGEAPDPAALLAAGNRARDEALAFWNVASQQLDALLAVRLGQLERQRLISFGGIALALVLVVAVITFVARGLTRQLAALITQLRSNSEQVASAAGEISSASQTLAQGASEQAASLEETSASLEEVSSMTKRNAQNAQSVRELSTHARTVTESGAAGMQEMSRSMAGIRQAASDLRTTMDGIRGASADVSKIIKTIDEIAFQTNLLALNAAVEAARAGEAGAGFAVVADEVRSLAQRSARAAKETADMIEASIKRTETGTLVTNRVVTAVEAVAEKATSVERQLAEILTQSLQMDQQITQIATASAEQSQGIAQVATAIAEMDKVTQSNAASAEEAASAAEELNAQAATLRGAVVELQALARKSSAADLAASPAPVRPAAPRDSHPRPVARVHAPISPTPRLTPASTPASFRDF